MKTAEAIAIDERRLLRRLDELAQRGALPGGGLYRALYTPAWVSATELVSGWMKEAGLLVRRDAVGNVWGRVEGSRGGRAIVSGSHIDTVRGGGALDGALGVVAAVEAVASLVAQLGRPLRILEAVAICEEEGSRFATNFWGARAMADRIEPDEAARVRDADGVTLADAMRGVGLDPANVAQAVRRDIDTFVELHIEQGPLLDEEGPRLGIVRTIAGTAHLEVVVRGQPDHAGATAMHRRRDALLGAAAMLPLIAGAAREMGPPAVATVGTIGVEPGQVNVVPGVARFTVDARHSDNALRTELVAEITKVCKVVGRERDLSTDVRVLRERAAVHLDERATDVARRACLACGVTPREMTSGAGHDAQILSAAAHAAMIFVPSIGGRSHCAEEATAAEDVILGTRALATALRDLAYT
ncbi:MAG TPA: hydantoinase/carbamoylase family amidase [Candidatus Limnocylindria bacterium]|nr:hydantoinase/carbamoylase family amidase [Candidatus Limnocylindria bacterium]